MDGDMRQQVEMLVEGTVVTMDAERRVIRDGAVAVDKGRIVDVGQAADLRARFEAERTLGGPRRFVIPGLIDCHNHLAQALVRDYALEDLPNIYRIYIPCEMALDAADAAVCAQFGIAQLLRSGVTTVRRDHVHRGARGRDLRDDPVDRHPRGDGARPGRPHLEARVELRAGRGEVVVPRRPRKARRGRGADGGVLPPLDERRRRPDPPVGQQPRRALVLRRALPADEGDRRAERHRDDGAHQPRPRGGRARDRALRRAADRAPPHGSARSAPASSPSTPCSPPTARSRCWPRREGASPTLPLCAPTSSRR